MTLCSSESRGYDGSNIRTPSGLAAILLLLLVLRVELLLPLGDDKTGDKGGRPIDRVGSYDDGDVGLENCLKALAVAVAIGGGR